MPNSRTLSDQELIDISHHWRRRSLGGDGDALDEARRHEAELRRRFREVDLATWAVSDTRTESKSELKSSLDSIRTAAEKFVIATADTSTQSGESLRELLRNLRELLEMDIAFVAEVVDGRTIFQNFDYAVSVEASVQEGTSLLSEVTLCQRVVDGRAPEVMHDINLEPGLAELDAVKKLNISAYLSTPVILCDGSVYGTLCCISHKPRSALGSRQLDSLRYVAGIVAAELDKRRGLGPLPRGGPHLGYLTAPRPNCAGSPT